MLVLVLMFEESCDVPTMASHTISCGQHYRETSTSSLFLQFMNILCSPPGGTTSNRRSFITLYLRTLFGFCNFGREGLLLEISFVSFGIALLVRLGFQTRSFLYIWGLGKKVKSPRFDYGNNLHFKTVL